MISLVVISFSQFTTNRSTTKITIDSKFENNILKHCFLPSSSITRTYFSCLDPFSSFFFSCGTQKNIQNLYQNIVPQFFARLLQRHLPMSVIWKLDNFKTLIQLLIRFFLFYYKPTGRCCIKLPVLFPALYSSWFLKHQILRDPSQSMFRPSRWSHETLQVTGTITIDWLEL